MQEYAELIGVLLFLLVSFLQVMHASLQLKHQWLVVVFLDPQMFYQTFWGIISPFFMCASKSVIFRNYMQIISENYRRVSLSDLMLFKGFLSFPQ